jgi:hypothetical protein
MSRVRLVGGGNEITLEGERVLANEVRLPTDPKGYGRPTKLWVIGHEHGAMAAVWAEHQEEAFDVAADADLLLGIKAEEETESTCPLGNHGDPYDLSYVWVNAVDLSEQPEETLLRFAEAREEGAETLGSAA